MKAARLTTGVWEAPFVGAGGERILVATDAGGTLLGWAAIPPDDPAGERAAVARLSSAVREAWKGGGDA